MRTGSRAWIPALTKMDGRLNQLTWMVGFVGVVVLANTGLVMGIAAKLFRH